jgi:O-antigen/teichoic acid export membrane protein
MPDAPASTSRLRGVLAGWSAPQHRDGLALVLSSGLTSVIGLLYWVVAARLFPPGIVGVNNTLISTMTLIAVAAQLNLGNALLRFVPVAERSARRLVLTCYAVGAVAAAAAGGIFALGAGWWAPELHHAVGGGPLAAFFVLSTPIWTVFVIQDYVLTAVKRAPIVPLENLVFSLLKIALLGVGALMAFGGAIALSWIVATALIVLAITAYLLRVLPAPAPGEPPTKSPVRPRAVARFVSADWTGGLFTNAVEFGLPLLVLVTLGAEQAATFGVAWAIAYGLYLVSHGMGQSLVGRARRAGRPGSVPAGARLGRALRPAQRERDARTPPPAGGRGRSGLDRRPGSSAHRGVPRGCPNALGVGADLADPAAEDLAPPAHAGRLIRFLDVR